MLRTRQLAIAAIAGVLLTATACSGGGAPPSKNTDSGSNIADSGPEYTIAMVTHEQPGTTFWDRVRAGAEQSSKQHNIDLKYSNDPQLGNQATLVQNAIDSKVDGIAATLAAPEAVGPVLQKASEAGIPTAVLNAGIDTYTKYGALMYFGSDESLAGESAGARIAKEGGQKNDVRRARRRSDLTRGSLCRRQKIIPQHRDPASQRSRSGRRNLHPPSQARPGQVDHQHRHPRRRRRDRGHQSHAERGSQAKIVTFDLNQEIVKAIQDKTIEFCVDQQPYLQGYLAVDTLWLNLTNGNDLGGGKPVLTGPSFVDSSNIDKIAAFAANNTR